jgi:hypothetical protein
VVHALTQVLTLWTVVGGCTYTHNTQTLTQRKAGRGEGDWTTFSVFPRRVWLHDVAPYLCLVGSTCGLDLMVWLFLYVCVVCVSLFQGGCGPGDHLHLGLRPLVHTPHHILHQYTSTYIVPISVCIAIYCILTNCVPPV